MNDVATMLLHLPIGIFILVLLQEITSCLRGTCRNETGIGMPLGLGVLSSIGAVIAGYMLWFNGDGAYGDIGERHLWGGTIFTCGVILVAILKKWTIVSRWSPMAYKIPLLISVGIMFFTSHDGGTMTHGAGFLTRYSPFDCKETKTGGGDNGQPAEPEVYANVIQPIFEKKSTTPVAARKVNPIDRMRMKDVVIPPNFFLGWSVAALGPLIAWYHPRKLITTALAFTNVTDSHNVVASVRFLVGGGVEVSFCAYTNILVSENRIAKHKNFKSFIFLRNCVHSIVKPHIILSQIL